MEKAEKGGSGADERGGAAAAGPRGEVLLGAWAGAKRRDRDRLPQRIQKGLAPQTFHVVQVMRGGNKMQLGSFSTAEEAALCFAGSPEGHGGEDEEEGRGGGAGRPGRRAIWSTIDVSRVTLFFFVCF